MKYLMIFALISWIILSSVLAQSQESQKTQQQRPNVLLLVVDDLKPLLGSYGDQKMKTPGIDRLAESGVLFENSYCQQAVCAPSRISFFTGKRPDRTKVYDLKTFMRDMNPDIITMPQFFKENGYETVGLGKLMHGARKNDPGSWSIAYKHDKKLKYAKGFDYPADGKYQDEEILAAEKVAQAQGLKTAKVREYLRENNLLPSVEALDIPDDAYSDGAIAENAVKLLGNLSAKNKPFFMALGFHKPHLPFAAPKKYWDLYDREEIEINPFQEKAANSPDYAYHTWGELRKYSDIPDQGELSEAKQKELIHGYRASVSYVDAQIGKVLEALADLGIEDNTIVILFGDHGWHLGDHGLWCKHSNFEQATRVPVLIRAPGYSKASQAETMMELVDVFPTVVEYTGLEIPGYLEGESLIPVLKDPEVQIKDYAISQYPRGKNIMGYTMRTQTHRLTLWLKGDYMNTEVFKNPQIAARELYDYVNDPQEKVSLANDPAYTDLVEELQSKLLTLLTEQAEAASDKQVK